MPMGKKLCGGVLVKELKDCSLLLINFLQVTNLNGYFLFILQHMQHQIYLTILMLKELILPLLSLV